VDDSDTDFAVPNIFSGCIMILPSDMWMLYVVPMIYESTVFGLTVWKIWSMNKEFGSTPLAQRLAEK
jgi:hypothetical protein